MTPSCTSGVAVFGPAGSDKDQASCSVATFRLSIDESGEKPSPSRVPRQVSQSFGEGARSNSSVTGALRASVFGASGQFGSSTPRVKPPPGPCARKRCCSLSSDAAACGSCATAIDVEHSAASPLNAAIAAENHGDGAIDLPVLMTPRLPRRRDGPSLTQAPYSRFGAASTSAWYTSVSTF